MIGYRTLPLTYIFMGVTGILSFPLGKLLDYILGDEVGMNYNRGKQLTIHFKTGPIFNIQWF